MFATALEIEHSSHEIVQQLNTDRTDLSRDSTRVTHDLNMKENLAKKVGSKLHIILLINISTSEKKHQLWKSTAPKRIKLQLPDWSHFKYLFELFKMRPIW